MCQAAKLATTRSTTTPATTAAVPHTPHRRRWQALKREDWGEVVRPRRGLWLASRCAERPGIGSAPRARRLQSINIASQNRVHADVANARAAPSRSDRRRAVQPATVRVRPQRRHQSKVMALGRQTVAARRQAAAAHKLALAARRSAAAGHRPDAAGHKQEQALDRLESHLKYPPTTRDDRPPEPSSAGPTRPAPAQRYWNLGKQCELVS